MSAHSRQLFAKKTGVVPTTITVMAVFLEPKWEQIAP